MTIWSIVKSTFEDTSVAHSLAGYDSLTDYFWNDMKMQNLVEDMSGQVKRGEINRAYEREPLIQKLISAVAQGVVILHGPPGSGKTSLFEELSYRVVMGDIPTFQGWKIVRLKLKQMKGNSSVEGKIDSFLDGGSTSRFQLLLKYIQKNYSKGSSCIILIDEIQDLLQDNMSMFDLYKEELARNQFHIIGATTNKNVVDALRTRGGSGAGMERRIEEIELKEMSSGETAKVISQRAQVSSGSHSCFEYTQDFVESIVTLAKSRYPKKIFPDCAVCFFEDVRRFYFDKNRGHSISIKVVLSSQEVVNYLSLISSQPKEALANQVKNQVKKASFQTEFADRFFPLIKPSPAISSLIEPEVARLEIFFRKFAASPFLFLRGESNVFLTQIAMAYTQQGAVVCDVNELIHNVKDGDERELMYETLRKRMHGPSQKPLLILKNFNSATILVPVTPTAVAKAEEIVHKIKNSPVDEILNQVSTTLGIGSSVSNLVTTSEPARQTKPLFIVEELLKWIEREEISTVVTLVSDITPERKQWSLFEVQPLNIDQTVEWLKGLFPQEQNHILPILAAFYYLKNSSLPFSVVDLTVQTLTILKADPDRAMLEVLGGFTSLKEIRMALESVTAGMEEQPWNEISTEEIRFSHPQNQTFPDIPFQSVLWVAENSTRRREWLALQMAGRMKTLPCYWYQPSLAWQKIPEPLKEQLLQRFFWRGEFKSDKILFINEGDLKEPALQKMLQKGGVRVICFYSPKLAPTQAANPSLPLMSLLVEQGKTMLKDSMVSHGPNSEASTSGLPSIAELKLKPLYYTHPSLTFEEQKQMLSFLLGDIPENLKTHILSLYLLLCKSNNSVDEIARRLEQDIDILKNQSVEQIYFQFTEFYGNELKMSLQEIQYTINPDLSSVRYRFYRFATSVFTNTLTLIFSPFRWVASYTTGTILPFLGRWILSKIVPSNN
jgi:hypothetical protein